MFGSERRWRVILVGAGFIGKVHAEVVTTLPTLTLVGIVDPDLERAQELAEATRVATDTAPELFVDLDQAMSALDADLVVVATPTGYHAANAVTAIEHGAHVLIEKPLDVHLEAAHRVIEATRQRPHLVAAVISQKRFEPASEAVKESVDTGAFGHVTSATVAGSLWRSQAYYDSGDWRGTWRLDGGGALMNQGVHSIDLLTWFLGRPVSIHAAIDTLAHERMEVEDTATALIEFAGGALATVSYTTAAYPGLPPRISVHGSQGSAVMEGDGLAFYHSAAHGVAIGDYGAASPDSANQVHLLPQPPVENHPTTIAGHRRQYEDLLSALEHGTRPRATVEDAYLSLATVCAVYEAAQIGSRLDFEDYIASAHLAPIQN